MANSILNSQPQQTPAQPNNQMLQQFQQFKRDFNGNPQQAVMNMIASGQRSQTQLQEAMNYARQFQNLFK